MSRPSKATVFWCLGVVTFLLVWLFIVTGFAIGASAEIRGFIACMDETGNFWGCLR